ncbi:hypothetical protein [Borrelia persica]|uniref:hypothetical protein n=1 Tax=Borrelia persica TaxID=44448 RepID=UPI000464E92E|nr:hypothetical protein [Borrelia persica]
MKRLCIIIFAFNMLSFSCSQSVSSSVGVDGESTVLQENPKVLKLKQAYAKLDNSFNDFKSLFSDRSNILDIPFFRDLKDRFNIRNTQSDSDLIYAIFKRDSVLVNNLHGMVVDYGDNHILRDGMLLLLGFYTLVENTFFSILEQDSVFGQNKLNKLKYSQDVEGINEIKRILDDMRLKWVELTILFKEFIIGLSVSYSYYIENHDDNSKREIIRQLGEIGDIDFIDGNQVCKSENRICELKNVLRNLRYRIEIKSNELIAAMLY